MIKRIAFAALSVPVTILAGWLATRLSERYEIALANIDYEFGFDE